MKLMLALGIDSIARSRDSYTLLSPVRADEAEEMQGPDCMSEDTFWTRKRGWRFLLPGCPSKRIVGF